MSNIRATTISDAAGTGPITLTGQSAAKAWVSLNGTGTAAIRDSMNVSSITDNSTGDYTINFGNSFNTSDYTIAGSANYAGNTSYNRGISPISTPTASSFRVNTMRYDTTTYEDCLFVYLANHGDLA